MDKKMRLAAAAMKFVFSAVADRMRRMHGDWEKASRIKLPFLFKACLLRCNLLRNLSQFGKSEREMRFFSAKVLLCVRGFRSGNDLAKCLVRTRLAAPPNICVRATSFVRPPVSTLSLFGTITFRVLLQGLLIGICFRLRGTQNSDSLALF